MYTHTYDHYKHNDIIYMLLHICDVRYYHITITATTTTTTTTATTTTTTNYNNNNNNNNIQLYIYIYISRGLVGLVDEGELVLGAAIR